MLKAKREVTTFNKLSSDNINTYLVSGYWYINVKKNAYRTVSLKITVLKTMYLYKSLTLS